MVPLQFAAVYPLFLTHEGNRSNEFWYSPLKDTMVMRRDRAFYLQLVQERAVTGEPTMKTYSQVIARKDEVPRYWWFVAASRTHIDVSVASGRWHPHVRACYAT